MSGSANSHIQLQENIPLTEEEIKQTDTAQKTMMRVAVITIAVAILLIGIIAASSVKEETLNNLKYYDYLVFGGIGLSLFGFCYFIAWGVSKYDRYNWEKDKSAGKSKLTSVVINRDKTEHAEYLTFAGPLENQKIRLEVKPEDYKRYTIGSKVMVTYLKFSKKAIEIIGLS